MKKYYVNPELRLSSLILLAISTLFLFCTLIYMKSYDAKLKRDYINTVGAVSAKILDKNPQLESDIMPLISHTPSPEEVKKGQQLLKNYGISDTLENQFFPYLDHSSPKSTYYILLIFLAMTSIFFILNYMQYGFFYKRLRSITLGAKKVIEGDFNINLNENKEGDLSKLAVSFNSMRQIIKSKISELNKEKQFLVDILSDISHQLKTPLSSMMVYNEIMLTKALSMEQSKKFLENNEKQLDKMNWLIQSLLKLAKIDAAAIEFFKAEQSLNETIEGALSTLSAMANNAEVNIYMKENKEIFFQHDSLWLQEALTNIIKNSIEHTPPKGNITIQALETPIYIRIIIEDTGEGISPEDLPNIFKRFYKTSTSRKTDSVGIGLALSKSIIEAHGGSIEAKSELGVGTVFSISFYK